MAGLILLAALIVLITLLIWLSGLIARWLPIPIGWKTLLRVLIVVGAFPLMLVDEIIGKYQFEALCKANGVERADVSRARGKKVRLEVGAQNSVDETIMPIKTEDWLYMDVDTGDLLFQHKDYYAMGGWLMRYTPLSMGSAHSMLFSGNGCSLIVRQSILDKAQVTVIN